MKIKMNNGEIDTDKMTDIDAVIMELAEQLRVFCKENNRQCFITVDAMSKEGTGAFAWNLFKKSTPENQELLHEDIQLFFERIDYAVGKISGGKLTITQTQKDDNSEG